MSNQTAVIDSQLADLTERVAANANAHVASRRPGSSSELLTLFLLAALSKQDAGEDMGHNLGITNDKKSSEKHDAPVVSKSLLRVLLAALRSYDPYIHTHSQRVAILATGIANKLGWSEAQQRELEVAALLHDFGKISVPQHILNKPGRLNSIEREIISRHLYNGTRLLRACRVPISIVNMIVDAERAQIVKNMIQNVSQYGTSIGSRILSVADAYDSLRCNQMYRSGKSHAEVMQILEEQSTARFDGSVVSALGHWVTQDATPRMMYEGEHLQDAPVAQSGDRLETVLAERNIHQIMQYLVCLDEHYSGFYLVDHKLDIILWSGGMQNVTGKPADELIQTDWKPELLNYYNEKRKRIGLEDQALLLAHSSKRSVLSTYYRMNENEQLDEFEVQSIPILNEKNQLLGVLEILFNQEQGQNAAGEEMQQLKLAATRDALTKIPNRGELELRLQSMWQQFDKRGARETFSTIFLDVDYFKSINDSHGHAVGDRVLIDLARLLETETYSGEIVGRYGGEEFVVLCPNTDLDMAIQKANRIRLAIENACIGGLTHAAVTSSFGVSQVEKGDTIADVVRRADKALYQAKETGRNKVCSLSRQDHDREVELKHETKQKREDSFVYEQKLTVCTSGEMIIYKLKAFLEANHAVLKEADSEHVRMRVGRAGLLSGWGKSPERQPVDLLLQFQKGTRKQGANNAAEIQVTVKPTEKVPSAAKFQNRAAQVVRNLREYLAGT